LKKAIASTTVNQCIRFDAYNSRLPEPFALLCRSTSNIPYEELDVQDQIGGGGFSLVYRGLWQGTPVAIKKWFDPQITDQLMQEFREEVMPYR
jgi:hypothetical protein